MARKGWQRHFDGWEVGAIIIAMAVICAWVAVPRPVTPTLVPVPRIDRVAEAREAAFTAEQAEAARRTPLSTAVRTVGERFRRYGVESSWGDQHGADYELERMRKKISDVLLDVGPEPLVQLRAVQTELFVQAAREWAAGYSASSDTPLDLRELGGNFAARAGASGWAEDNRLAVSAGTLAAFFRVRWSRLTGLDKHPFAPSLTDELLVARTTLERPLLSAAEEPLANPDGANAALTLRQLGAVHEIVRRRPGYPAGLARGVLLYRSGDYDAALSAFTLHLETHPNGPWALRATNYRAGTLKALGWLP